MSLFSKEEVESVVNCHLTLDERLLREYLRDETKAIKNESDRFMERVCLQAEQDGIKIHRAGVNDGGGGEQQQLGDERHGALCQKQA